jgi:hypothetical protein
MIIGGKYLKICRLLSNGIFIINLMIFNLNLFNYSNLNSPSKLDQSKIKLFEKDSSPAFAVISYLGTRSIKVNELIQSFYKLNLDAGLAILGVPEVDMVVVKPPPSVIRIKSGATFEIECKVESFPKPTYEYFKSGQKLDFQSIDGLLRIDSIQYILFYYYFKYS